MNPNLLSSDQEGHSPIIIALDFFDDKLALPLIRSLDPSLCKLKIGQELFTAAGRSFVESLINQGFQIFLDLKFLDIPNTVKQACKVAAEMGVWMLTIHTLGGRVMIETVANELAKYPKAPLLIGVTILTSMEQNDISEIGIETPLLEEVIKLTTLAHDCGANGVVCSSQEAHTLKQTFADELLLVTPGIRLASDKKDDQKRVLTPLAALKAGSDYLVIGRSITQSTNPRKVLDNILFDIQKSTII